MEISLNSAWRKRLLVGGAASLCLVYLVFAGGLFLASLFADRPEIASLQRAAHLDPGNADYRTHAARYWFDLASAYQVLGDISNQTWALEHAIQADPTTPDVAWEAANFYLVQGDNQKALREFHVVLEYEPSLANLAIQFCWRINPDVDALLRDVIPAKSTPYIAFLDLLMTKQETAATAKVWAALIATSMATSEIFEKREAYEYFQYLLDHKDVDQARVVWQQATKLFHLSSYDPTRNNLVVNGDFSLDILNGGFDWRYQKQPSVSLTLDPSDFHS